MNVMQDDWLMKQLTIVPLKLSTVKETNDDPLIDVEDDITGERRSVPLTQLLLEKIVFLKVSEAENILFESLERLSTSQIRSTSEWFYNKLDELSEDDLKQGGFSKEEILQGKRDIEKTIGT